MKRLAIGVLATFLTSGCGFVNKHLKEPGLDDIISKLRGRTITHDYTSPDQNSPKYHIKFIHKDDIIGKRVHTESVMYLPDMNAMIFCRSYGTEFNESTFFAKEHKGPKHSMTCFADGINGPIDMVTDAKYSGQLRISDMPISRVISGKKDPLRYVGFESSGKEVFYKPDLMRSLE